MRRYLPSCLRVFVVVVVTAAPTARTRDNGAFHTTGFTGADPSSVTHTNAAVQFEENQGQADPRVGYTFRGRGMNLFLTDEQAVIVLADGAPKRTIVRLELSGSCRTKPVGRRALPATTNYFLGRDPEKWRTHVPTYAEVAYVNAYDGIDWVFRGNGSQLEFDFLVAPGADVRNIRLHISGADSVDMARQQLAINVSGRRFDLSRLSAFQKNDGERVEVPVRYTMQGANHVGFDLQEYDTNRPLTIDPVLEYSTYIGGSNTDRGFAPAIDRQGRAYVTGTTRSLDFPTEDPQQPSSGGNFDAFIAKFSPDGSALEYSTYFGGSRIEEGFGIAVDNYGNAYVSGRTTSTNMPVVNALQPTFGGGSADVFIMKIDSTGSQLLFSTYFGGTGDDRGFDARLDANRELYISGTTDSSNFPTVDALQPTSGGGQDAFLTKMNSTGSAILYSTYLGGSGTEQFGSLAVDHAGRAAVVGKTTSTDFPIANAVQPFYGGGTGDVFVSRYDISGLSFIYSTYLGGTGDDQGFAAAVTPSGDTVAAGNTFSTNYPTMNPIQSTLVGARDMIITKLDQKGQIVFSTYLGGSGNENVFGVASDPSGNVYFSGFTGSVDFPLSDPLQSTPGGNIDAALGKIRANGDSLIFSTYFGGSGEDRSDYVVVDPAGNAYFSGWTASTNFPVTPGAFQTSFAGPQFDAFLVKLAEIQAAAVHPGWSNSPGFSAVGRIPR